MRILPKIYTLIATLLLCCVTSTTFAQSRSFDCTESSSKDEKILSQIQKAYEGMTSLQANFRQDSFLAALEAREGSQGEVAFERPGKMRWHYTKPDEQFFYINDQTLWLYQVEDRQVLVSDLSSFFVTDLPAAFLMGIGDLSRDFSLIDSCRGGDGTIVTLRSKSRPAQKEESGGKLDTMKLLVDSAYLPKGAEVHDMSGNKTSIVFDEIQRNASIEKRLFEPSFPKGVDIQDKRVRK